ncbi:Origin recognition complex subunit 2 [Vanrija albida]|uniref:Origin recognition complex subunit 2 n=1 Tax=Vanrija albida TaxID=181172 RepID=A0ABR3PXC6_9TREE
MPPAVRKKPRRASPEAEAGPSNEAGPSTEPSASHLVSFLTSYADRERGSSASGSDDEGSASGSGTDHEPEDPDDDGGQTRTPAKRGLVGTPSKRRKTATTPTSTPRRRAAGTPKSKGKAPATPLKPTDEGFVRASRADGYFLTTSRSARTSGQSYTSLAQPLSQAEYEAAANGVRAGQARVHEALERASAHFDQWAAELEAGFNLLLYGYGSKRRVANRFLESHLAQRGHCAVVNGHFPQLGIRDVLAALEDTLKIADAPAPPAATPLERAAYRLYAAFSGKRKTPPLFLVLHNIDAPALRTPKALAALSLLASSPRIHLVATFDHVNTPLLFSATLNNTPPHAPGATVNGEVPPSRGFNWLYHSVPTFDDYDVELAYARLSAATLALEGGGGRAGISEEGTLQILRSVPPMAARLLKVILTTQVASLPADSASHVAHPPAQTAPGFALDVDLLQRTARDKFIAREEDRFNALLGEFRDHGLVIVVELDAEGRSGRWAWVPLGKAAIERILDEMKDVEG